MKCPNPNISPYREVGERRGTLAVYLLDLLITDAKFMEWNKQSEIDIDTDSLVITSADGNERHLDDLLRLYVQLPRDMEIAEGIGREFKGQDVLIERKFSHAYRTDVVSIRLGGEEFIIAPLAYSAAYEEPQIRKALEAISSLQAEERKEWKELAGWYDLHQKALAVEDARPYNEEPWNATVGGVPASFDEFFRRALRDVSMRGYLGSLGLKAALTNLAPWVSDLNHINTVPQTTTQVKSNTAYQGWFGPIDTRLGENAKTMLGRALEYAKKNGRPWEARLLDIILRRYGSHLRNTIVKTTDVLVDSEGVQQFSTRDGKGTILLSEALDNNKDIYRVLVHEVIHAVTKQLFSGSDLNAAEAKFVNRLTQLYHLAKASATDEHYQAFSMKGMVSVEEFVSELFSNMEFRKAVQSMTFNEENNIWDKFVGWVKDLFGFGKDHFEDIFNIQQLVSQVSNFQRATNHKFPLHESYSRIGTNRSYKDPNIVEDDALVAARELIQYYENMINELWNSPQFFTMSEEEIADKVRDLKAKIRMNNQMIDDIELKKSDFFIIYDNFLSEAHREIREIDIKLSFNTMDAVSPAEQAFWLKQLSVLRGQLNNLDLMAHEDPAWERFLGDGRREQILGDLSLITKNMNALSIAFKAGAIGTLMPFDSITEWREIEKAKTEFRRNNPGKKSKDYADRQRKYVAKHMSDNKKDIEEEKKKRLKESLRFLPADIIMFLNRSMPYQQSTDPIIAMTGLFFNAIDDKARQQTLAIEKEFLALYEEYVKVSGRPRSFIDMWDPVLEKDSEGKVTGHMLSKYRVGEWEKAREAEWDRIEKLVNDQGLDEIEEADMKSDFYNKNVEREYIDLFYDVIDKHGQNLTEEAEVIGRQIRHIIGGFEGEWVNPEALTTSELIHLGKMYSEMDEKNGYEDAGAGLSKALKAVGIETRGRIPNPKLEAYTKKLIDLKKSGRMTQKEASDALKATYYKTKRWEVVDTTDSAGNKIPVRTLVEKNIQMPFSSRMNIIAAPKGPLKAVKNDRYVKGKETLKADWLNKDYEAMQARDPEDAVRKMYEFMVTKNNMFDKKRPPDKRLNFRLPNIRKTAYEMWAESEMSTRKKIWTFLSEDLVVHKDDVEWGDLSEKDDKLTRSVKEDLRGETNKFVPILFTGKPEDLEMQSFNLATLFMANAEMSIKQQFLVRAAPQLLGLKELMRTDPETGHRTVGTPERRKGDERWRAKGKTNAEELFNLMLDDKLFGMRKSPDQNMTMVKLLQGIQNYTSLLYLGGNVTASIQNTVYGRISTSLETLSGGMITKKGRRKAERAYWREGNLIEMMSDWRRQTSEARVHQIMDLFNGTKDFSARRNDYGRQTKMRQWGQAGLLMEGHMSGEHHVQTVVALSVLADTLVMNENDEYINDQGEVVESPSDAMSLLDAFQKNKEGDIAISDVVKKIEWRGHIKAWASEAQMYSSEQSAVAHGENEARTFLAERMQGMNTMIHGAYGDSAKSEYERYWQFRMGTQMRKWLIMGFRRRWIFDSNLMREWTQDFGARTESGKKRRKEAGYQQLWERELGYADYDLAIVNEGMYITVIKYMSALVNMFKTNEHAFGGNDTLKTRNGYVWESFNSHQRANIKRFGVELGFMAAFSTILPMILLLLAADDDDDEMAFRDKIDVVAGMNFSMMRMSMELGMYYSIPNLLSAIQNPAVSVGFMKNAYNFVDQAVTSPLDRYTSGSRSQQYKMWKKGADVIPGVRAINNLFYLKDKMNYANLNK